MHKICVLATDFVHLFLVLPRVVCVYFLENQLCMAFARFLLFRDGELTLVVWVFGQILLLWGGGLWEILRNFAKMK